ncbi:hypothetical protein [uncultured Methanofollis sp.]|uniref:hypothetical protein n=1 Tax=uncultured Methanofollis sp. TaxID=262500 RepID=UPI002628536C|nr:hypothetical protein [uncultured Methanofollis sp.]
MSGWLRISVVLISITIPSGEFPGGYDVITTPIEDLKISITIPWRDHDKMGKSGDKIVINGQKNVIFEIGDDIMPKFI